MRLKYRLFYKGQWTGFFSKTPMSRRHQVVYNIPYGRTILIVLRQLLEVRQSLNRVYRLDREISGYFSGGKNFVVEWLSGKPRNIYSRMINSDLVPRPPANNRASLLLLVWHYFGRKGNSEKLPINMTASSNSEVRSAVD